jgi:uncharacterized membrane protein
MALRLHELHPTLVHFPLALFPLAVLADVIGKITGRAALMRSGKVLMPIASGSALVTAGAGLIAQESVKAEGRGRDLLITHRNMNLALVAATLAMTATRLRTQEPGWGYLAAGLGALAAMSVSAYLGGKMVYEHGIGVRPLGLRDAEAPELLPSSAGQFARQSRRNLARGAKTAMQDLRRGAIAPALR